MEKTMSQWGKKWLDQKTHEHCKQTHNQETVTTHYKVGKNRQETEETVIIRTN